MNLSERRDTNRLSDPLCWAIFMIYVLLLAFTMVHHEPWGDEIHSWNIAKASNTFADLISNRRYEGHPPVWYVILWTISKFTHNLAYVQLVHSIIAASVVFLILFFSPFPFSTKILMPFGYYFLFEYAVLSRNYAIGVLLVFCICLVMRKTFRYKFLVYYLLLFLLSNTHLLGLMLAITLHFYYLLMNIEQEHERSIIALHVFLGIVVLLPSFIFMYPPADSQLNLGFWVDRWSLKQLSGATRAPLLAFIPLPAWWNYHFWNTQFLIEWRQVHSGLKYLNFVISIVIVVLAYLVLRPNRKARLVFLANLLLCFIMGITFFSLTTERYAGFLLIGFIAAYWLFCDETPVTTRNKWLVNGFLIVQIIGGIFTISKDIRLPFSNAYRVNELIKEVPVNQKAVTDYWAMNTISAFTDRPFYCIDLQKEKSFVMWNSDVGYIQNRPYRYFEGVKHFFQQQKISKVYMISIGSPTILFKVDSLLFKSYNVRLIDKREGAIEKGGNLYLYEINSF